MGTYRIRFEDFVRVPGKDQWELCLEVTEDEQDRGIVLAQILGIDLRHVRSTSGCPTSGVVDALARCAASSARLQFETGSTPDDPIEPVIAEISADEVLRELQQSGGAPLDSPIEQWTES